MRKGCAFPQIADKKKAARLSLAAKVDTDLYGKAEPYRTGCGKAANYCVTGSNTMLFARSVVDVAR
jgi:hypothetical protein